MWIDIPDHYSSANPILKFQLLHIMILAGKATISDPYLGNPACSKCKHHNITCQTPAVNQFLVQYLVLIGSSYWMPFASSATPINAFFSATLSKIFSSSFNWRSIALSFLAANHTVIQRSKASWHELTCLTRVTVCRQHGTACPCTVYHWKTRLLLPSASFLSSVCWSSKLMLDLRPHTCPSSSSSLSCSFSLEDFPRWPHSSFS